MIMWDVTERCTYWYRHQMATEDKASYNNSWQNPFPRSYNLTTTDSSSPFVYTSAASLRGSLFWGGHSIYEGGGYTILLGRTREKAHETIAWLRRSRWIDPFTRALFIQLSILNVDSGLFSMATIVFETPPVGGVSYKKDIQSIQLYRYVGVSGLAAILLELACLAAFIWLTVKIAGKIKRERWEFFRGSWNLTYVFVVLTFFTAVGLYIWRSVLTVSTLEEVLNNLGEYGRMTG